MSDTLAAKIVCDALQWRRAYPAASALDVLDQAMEGHEGSDPDFGDDALAYGDWFDPRSAFGQLVVEAFDKGMPPADWIALTCEKAEPAIADAVMGVWHTEVSPAFAARYRLWGAERVPSD